MIKQDQLLNTLTEAFPRFTFDAEDADTPYVVLAGFARFLLELYRAQDDQGLKTAALLIERFHIEGDSYVKEAATIGLLEDIQNLWEQGGVDPEEFADKLLPVSQRWWYSLMRFWRREIPYVGADLDQNESAPHIF